MTIKNSLATIVLSCFALACGPENNFRNDSGNNSLDGGYSDSGYDGGSDSSSDYDGGYVDGGSNNDGGYVDGGINICVDGDSITSSCGLNGRGNVEKVCVNGRFSEGVCQDPDVCIDGNSERINCGLNNRGLITKKCINGQFINGYCQDPDECFDGEFHNVLCGLNNRGNAANNCINGQYVPGECIDPDVCVDGDSITSPCGLNGRANLLEKCVNGNFVRGLCDDLDVCIDNSSYNKVCGLNNRGNAANNCINGQYVPGECIDPDVCKDNAINNVSCGLNNRGTLVKKCINGNFVNGHCNDPDECMDNDTYSISCGLNNRGTLERHCENGNWIDGSCDDSVLNCNFDNTFQCKDMELPIENRDVSFVPGKHNSAILMQEGASLIYSYNNNFNIQRGTISFWFQPTNHLLDGQNHVFFQHQSLSNNANLRFRFLPSSQNNACNNCYETYIFTGTDQGASKQLSSADETTDNWYYMTTSWDASAIKIYLNGDLLNTYTGTLNIGSPSDRINIGSYPPYGRNAVANGKMDDLKIYDYVRSDVQINEDFESSK